MPKRQDQRASKTGEPNSEYWPGKGQMDNMEMEEGMVQMVSQIQITTMMVRITAMIGQTIPVGSTYTTGGETLTATQSWGLAHIHLGLSKDIYVASAFIKA